MPLFSLKSPEFCTMMFKRWTKLFQPLNYFAEFFCVFSVKAVRKLHGRKPVGNINIKNKLAKSKQERIYLTSCMYTTSDITRSLNLIPQPGHNFTSKSQFQQLKTHCPVGFDKNKVTHDYNHAWNYRLGKEKRTWHLNNQKHPFWYS